METVLQKRSLKDISDGVTKAYDNFILDSINDHCLRLAVMEQEYPWHYHPHTDELFLVVEGTLKIDIRDAGTIYLEPGEFLTIPANTIHKTAAIGRTVNLTFEKDAAETVFIEPVAS